MRFVIDTNIWKCALTDTPDWRYDCDIFLRIFMESNHNLSIDHKCEILKEYNDNLKYNEKYWKFYTMLEQQGRVTFVDSSLPGKHLKKLIELKFHEPEDHVFTGTAYNADKYIVTEESDYGKGRFEKAKLSEKHAVLKYMTDNMDMFVLDSVEAKMLFNTL